MNFITLEESEFMALVEQVVKRLGGASNGQPALAKWLSKEEAMKHLNIGKTTLQKLRNEGQIRFSQPQKKVIVYDRDSLDEYLEKNASNTF